MPATVIEIHALLDAHGLHHCCTGGGEGVCLGVGSGAHASEMGPGSGRCGCTGISGRASLGQREEQPLLHALFESARAWPHGLLLPSAADVRNLTPWSPRASAKVEHNTSRPSP